MAGKRLSSRPGPGYLCTAAAIIVSLLQIGVKFVRREKIDPMLWISVAVILAFGSLTIWLHDEMFIKWKPTILYWIFGGILLAVLSCIRTSLSRFSVIKFLFRNLHGIVSFAVGFVFFAVTGVLNLIVAYTCSTDVWVNFKLFGLMGLTLLFTLGVGFYISRFIPESDSEGK